MKSRVLGLCLLAPLTALALPPAATTELAAAVRPITTEVRFADGAMQRNRGSGFVVGRRFYTAYHNLQALAGTVVEHRILLGGERVRPLAVDTHHDLAVFDLPDSLCRAWCNGLVLDDAEFRLDTIIWLEGAGVDPHWERASVRNVAFKDAPELGLQTDCDANLVVEIETAFVSGDSGGPVFDPDTGSIVGLIQGSFEDSHGRATGYFKPARCVRARLGKAAP